MKTIVKNKKIPAAIKPFLRSERPRTARIRTWDQLTETDLTEFKKACAARPDDSYKRRERQDIKKSFGKSLKELSLVEFQDYRKPNFHAAYFLKELWPQLTPDEQDLVKQTNQWAFVFPASFETEKHFLQACAGRLQKFFNRKFKVK